MAGRATHKSRASTRRAAEKSQAEHREGRPESTEQQTSRPEQREGITRPLQSCRGRTRPRTSRGGARRRGRMGPWTSRGEEEAGPRGRRRCPGRRGSSRTGRDVQGSAVPRGRGDTRGCGVAVAPPGEFSRALFSVSPSSLFPSVD